MYLARGNAHFQQHASGYFAFKRLVRCSDDRSLPLVEKNLRFDGFSGRKLPSSRQGPDRRLFFGAALIFTSYYEESDRGQTITAKKPRQNRLIHTKKHRDIYIFNRFHHDYNAKIRLQKKKQKKQKNKHSNKSQKRETKVRDAQQSEAHN